MKTVVYHGRETRAPKKKTKPRLEKSTDCLMKILKTPMARQAYEVFGHAAEQKALKMIVNP